MMIAEYVAFLRTLAEGDRELLDRLVAKVMGDAIRHGSAPSGAALAIRISRAAAVSGGKGLTAQESEALAAYAMAGAANLPVDQGKPMQATQGMQEMQMSFNMQYLQLQNSMQNDN